MEKLRAQGIAAVTGDASTAECLIQAHVTRAAVSVIATPDTLRARQMIEIARTLNPQIKVAIRSHNAAEARDLKRENAGTLFLADQSWRRA